MKKTSKVLYWAPRILSILFICFLAMFSLDVFEQGKSIQDIMIGLLMHNIPSLIMIVLLVIAWKKEIVGTIGYWGGGLLFIGLTVFRADPSGSPWYLVITKSLIFAGPAFLIGALFLIGWKRRSERNR